MLGMGQFFTAWAKKKKGLRNLFWEIYTIDLHNLTYVRHIYDTLEPLGHSTEFWPRSRSATRNVSSHCSASADERSLLLLLGTMKSSMAKLCSPGQFYDQTGQWTQEVGFIQVNKPPKIVETKQQKYIVQVASMIARTIFGQACVSQRYQVFFPERTGQSELEFYFKERQQGIMINTLFTNFRNNPNKI